MLPPKHLFEGLLLVSVPFVPFEDAMVGYRYMYMPIQILVSLPFATMTGVPFFKAVQSIKSRLLLDIPTVQSSSPPLKLLVLVVVASTGS